MTLKLFIIAAAVVLAVSGCVVRPIGEDPGYYYSGGNSGERAHESRDRGDRDYRGGHEDQERRNDR